MEIMEEYKKVLWNYSGSSDEIFSHGWPLFGGHRKPGKQKLEYVLPSPYSSSLTMAVVSTREDVLQVAVASATSAEKKETRGSLVNFVLLPNRPRTAHN
jgi:hypothetical protein